MAKSVRDLADSTLDGTYPDELRRMGRIARLAWELQTETDTAHYVAHAMLTPKPYHPQLRQIAADAYALWRLIETTCQPIVEAWEREQDVRDTEEIERLDAEISLREKQEETVEGWEFDEAHLGGM